MMETFEAIEKRRSVKHYDAQHAMSSEEIEKLMSAAVLAPTSFNIQNWRFLVAQDPELRASMRAAAWDQAQVTDSSITVLVCGDLRAHARAPERYWADAPEEVQNMLVPMIGKFYEGNDQLQRDEAMRPGGLAAQNLMLAAKAMGYDSCPMIGFDPVEVGRLVHLPDDYVITMMVTIGKAAKPAQSRGGQLPLSEVVSYDRF